MFWRRVFSTAKLGAAGERRAAWFYRLRGWTIVARNVRSRGGEIDLIVRRGRTLAFVEVKARGSAEAAEFALDEWRLRRVVVAAEQLAPRYMREGDEVRIDAMLIVSRRWPKHLPNVWQG